MKYRWIFALLCSLAMMLAALFAVAGKTELANSNLVLDIENKGKIVIHLYGAEAPKTTKRIVELAQSKFYDGQRFFKVIRSPRPFLAQVGDPNSRSRDLTDPSMGTGGTGKKLGYEDSGIKHKVGSVGLSRLPDDPDSGDCQFYILLGPAGFLDGNYTVFGQVTEGLDLLNKLEVGDRISTARVESAK